MGCKAMEAALNINNVFGPETANEHAVQWCFKKFCKDEEHSGQPLEVDKNQMRAIIKADSLKTTGEVAEELSDDRSMAV